MNQWGLSALIATKAHTILMEKIQTFFLLKFV